MPTPSQKSNFASSSNIEKTNELTPRFDKNGLVSVVVTDFLTGEVLMVAWMNAEAMRLSIETGFAHFWSRSREALWKKGEESGNFLRIKEMRIDCDQDALWLKVLVQGGGVACHTGQRSCFYRTITVPTDELKQGLLVLHQAE